MCALLAPFLVIGFVLLGFGGLMLLAFGFAKLVTWWDGE
jgi:hypothetical protein